MDFPRADSYGPTRRRSRSGKTSAWTPPRNNGGDYNGRVRSQQGTHMVQTIIGCAAAVICVLISRVWSKC